MTDCPVCGNEFERKKEYLTATIYVHKERQLSDGTVEIERECHDRRRTSDGA